MKKYAIIGSHGVGKSVLANNLYEKASKEISCRKIGICQEVVRDCPFPINDKSSIDGGYWIVTEQITRELEAKAQGTDILLCDRSAIDPVLYLRAGNRFNGEKIRELFEFAHDWIKTYDKIVFISADKEKTIESDGFRDTNKEFQMIVDNEFKYYMNSIMYEVLGPRDFVELKSINLMNEKNTLEEIYNYLFWNQDD